MATTKKAITAGSEVDSYCTKCKMDLNHRVIAMEGEKIKKVECLTCRGHHNWRIPKSQKKVPKKRAKKASTRKKVAVPDYHKVWEQAIMGSTPDDFTSYNIAGVFQVGELLRHKKFGDGVVSEIFEGGKIQVIFEPGPKTLVYGR
jgi:Zn ribbon nucleic-acid-binding protein